jgi:hypothetical protein
LKDIVTTDFMKDIIDEMDLDIDEGAMEDILGQLDKKPEDKPPAEEEKKD